VSTAENPTGTPGRDPGSKTRDRQTRRTKRALLAAADEIFAEGRVPTVADVAERADVARATAYRYFPTQETLLLETTFLGNSGPIGSPSELVNEIKDPSERVAEAARRAAAWTLDREARLRTILRMSLEHESVQRPARRRHYIAQLLGDIETEIPADAYERLTGSLTLLFGIDPIISIRDNSDIPPDRIPDLLAWAAHVLVRSALEDSQPPSKRRQTTRHP